MDPFSIGVGCASLIQMIIISSFSISSFVKSSRHARHELEQVDKQLGELKFILDIFQDDVRPHEAALTVVESHRDAIFDLFNTAREAIEGVDLLIREHDGVLGPGRWALTGKTKVQNLTRTLEASIGRLKDVMDAVTSCNVRETVSELRELHTHFAETKEGILDLRHMSRQQSIENGHTLSRILTAVSRIQSQVCGERTSCLDDDLNEQLESEDSCPSPSTYCHEPLSSATSTWISSSPSPIPDFDPQPNKDLSHEGQYHFVQVGPQQFPGPEPCASTSSNTTNYRHIETTNRAFNPITKEDKIRSEVKQQVWEAAQLSSPPPTKVSTSGLSTAVSPTNPDVSNEEVRRRFKDQVQQKVNKAVSPKKPHVSSRPSPQPMTGCHRPINNNPSVIQEEFKRKVNQAASARF